MIIEYFTRFYEELIKFFTLDMSSPTEFAGQLVGFIPLILSFITFSLAKREHILISKTLSDLTSVVHFFLLGEVVGGAVCLVNTGRGIVFYNKGKKWASGIYIPIIFSAITMLTTLLQWKGWYTVLPAVGSVLAVIGFWCNRPRLVKLFNLPAVTLWLIYSIIIVSISATIINVISIVTILISIIREFVAHVKAKSNADTDSSTDENTVKDGE
jgi:hypothetical protein